MLMGSRFMVVASVLGFAAGSAWAFDPPVLDSRSANDTIWGSAYNQAVADSEGDGYVCSGVGHDVVDSVVLGGVDHGDWWMYKAVDFGTGLPYLTAAYAVFATDAGKHLSIYIDSVGGEKIYEWAIAGIGSGWWDLYTTTEIALSRTPTGVHDLYFRCSRADSTISKCGGAVNLRWLLFHVQPSRVKEPRTLARGGDDLSAGIYDGSMVIRLPRASAMADVAIVSCRGSVLKSSRTNDAVARLSLEGVTPGSYVLRVKTADRMTVVPFVVER